MAGGTGTGYGADTTIVIQEAQNRRRLESIIDVVKILGVDEIYIPNSRGVSHEDLMNGFTAEGYDINKTNFSYQNKRYEFVACSIGEKMLRGIKRTE
ncbi:MAG: hypothetical protein Q7S56_03300 [Nanoarchaeota archaeon]|nr:hypothetical protein [Nanoarchaeota archaeon]